MSVYFGKYQKYFWIFGDHRIRDLLLTVPELVVGKSVTITAFDGGLLPLNDAELEAGWRRVGGLAISPTLSSPLDIPLHDEYNELYVFSQETSFDREIEVFVNHGDLHLRDAADIEKELHPTWDRGFLAYHTERQTLFWDQLLSLNPESYLADGTHLYLITIHRDLFEMAKRFFLSE